MCRTGFYFVDENPGPGFVSCRFKMLPAWCDFFELVFYALSHIGHSFIVRAIKTTVPVQPLLGTFDLEMMESIEKQMWDLAFIQPKM
jgi:hypothetical protein